MPSPTALAFLSIAAIATLLLCTLGPIELGITLLLIVLALGMETLDISSLLRIMPVMQAFLAIVPTGSITYYDLLAGLLVLSLTARLLLRGQAPLPRGARVVGKALVIYIAVVLITTLIASAVIPFARLGWSLLYLLRLAFSALPFGIIALARPRRVWVQRYMLLYAALAIIPMLRTAAEGWDPSALRFRNYFALIFAGGFSAMGLGTYLGSVAGLGLGVIATGCWRKRRLAMALAWGAVLASMFTVVLTQKRAPFVGFFLLLLSWPLLPPRGDRRRWAVGTLLLVLLVAGAVARGGILNRTYLDDAGMIESLKEVDQNELLPESRRRHPNYSTFGGIIGFLFILGLAAIQ